MKIAKFEIAKKLISKGENISFITDLTIKEIEELKNSLVKFFIIFTLL